MTRIDLLVPSRGRPQRAAEMVASARAMAEGPVEVRVIVDRGDPELEGYRPLAPTVLDERLGYTASLNRIARTLWHEEVILGAFGDDVIFRTPGWDRSVREALATPGMAYGDDLIHGKNHPTAVFMSASIARALGWLALPATSHQWADDAWKLLGQQTGLLRFLPDVVVEHMHPAVHKAPWDDTYQSVFDAERAQRDFAGYSAWAQTTAAEDAERVRRAVG